MIQSKILFFLVDEMLIWLVKATLLSMRARAWCSYICPMTHHLPIHQTFRA